MVQAILSNSEEDKIVAGLTKLIISVPLKSGPVKY